MKKNSPYSYLGFILIIMLLIKLIFVNDAIAWLAHALKPLFLVLIIIYLINPLVNFLQNKTKLNRNFSVLVAFLICFAMVVGFISLILPSITESGRVIIANIPSNNEQFLTLIEKLPFVSYIIDTSSLSSFLDALGQWVISFNQKLMGYSDEILGTVKHFLTAISLGVLSLLMAYYALRDNEKISASIEEAIQVFIPNAITDSFLKIMHLMDAAFKKFLIGKLYTCIILGVLVTGMILLFNWINPWHIAIPYAPLIGFIIGATNIIPYIGPIIGAVPCLFLAILSGTGEAIALLIILTLAQQVDNIVVGPKILGDQVGLGPFWVLLAITVGGDLFGMIGMILFVPFTSVLLKLAMTKIEAYRKEKQIE